MIDVESTIISQYGASRTITTLIEGMNVNIDPRADIQKFYDYVWNIETAQGFGLDTWGNIIGIDREITVPSEGPFFGFSNAPGYYPFNEGTFYQSGATTTFKASDTAYRTMLLTKALSNISATNAPSINRLLQNLFSGRGKCYCNDLGGMSMRLVFEFPLQSFERVLLSTRKILPSPAGVLLYIFSVPSEGVFGFSQALPDSQTFNNGVFLPEGSVIYAT